MKKIVVTNGDWNGARAKLKTTLEAQNASFNSQLRAVFAPPKPQGNADGQHAPTPAEKRERLLARSQKHG